MAKYKLNLENAPTDYEALLKWVSEQSIEAPDQKDYDNLKSLDQKKNAENAELKRKLAEKMDEKERAEAERQAKLDQIMEENERLKKSFRISHYNTKLLDAGLDSESAASLANSLPPDVSDDVFATIKAHNAAQRQKIQDELLSQQGSLSKGKPPEPAEPEDDIMKGFAAKMKI